MFPRVNYEMTEADLEKILDACKPTICIKIGEYEGSSPQENANRAWEELGVRMGFDHMTVQPIEGKGNRFFSAVPLENETQRIEREQRESSEHKRLRIEALKSEIKEREEQLRQLQT